MKNLKEYLVLSKTINDRMNDSNVVREEFRIKEVKNVSVDIVRREDVGDFDIPLNLSNQGGNNNKCESMTQVQIRKLTEMIKAMSPEEKNVVVEALPVDICFERIKNEYERNQMFISSVMNSFSVLSINK